MKLTAIKCPDERECFAKDANGLCWAINPGFTAFSRNEKEPTPLCDKLFGKTHISRAYEDGQCAFCKPCYYDVVVDKQIKKKHREDCSFCPVRGVKCRKGS